MGKRFRASLQAQCRLIETPHHVKAGVVTHRLGVRRVATLRRQNWNLSVKRDVSFTGKARKRPEKESTGTEREDALMVP